MKYRNNVFILLVKGDCIDAGYSTNVFFIPMKEEELATYLFNRLKELEGKFLREIEWQEQEENFLMPYIPKNGYDDCYIIKEVLMFRVKNKQFTAVKPTDKLNFKEILQKYQNKNGEYSWSN